MAIKIGSLKRINLEVASLIYQKLEVANLAYAKPEVGTLTYLDPEFSDVYLDPDTKNKVTHEISVIMDSYFVSVSLAKTDNTSAVDTYAIALRKAVEEIVNLGDTSLLNITKNVLDESVVTDIVRLSINKAFDDNASMSEHFNVQTIKTFNDSMVSSDLFNMVVDYVRKFEDYIAIDDFAGIDKYYNGAKHNVVGAIDHAVFALNMLKGDVTGANDLLINIQTSKYVHETVGFVDALRKVSIHALVDAPLVSDVVALVMRNKLNDSTDGLTDTLALASELSKGDMLGVLSTLRKRISTVYSDTQSITDAHVIGTTKYVHDTVQMDDAFGYLAQVVASNDNSTSMLDLLKVVTSKGISDTPIITESLQKIISQALTDQATVADVAAIVYRKSVSDITDGLLDNLSISTSLKYADAVGTLSTLRKSVITKLVDTTGTTDLTKMVMSKYLHDAVGIDDSFDFLGKVNFTKGNVTIVSDLLSIRLFKELEDTISISELFKKDITRNVSDSSIATDVLAMIIQSRMVTSTTSPLDHIVIRSSMTKNDDVGMLSALKKVIINRIQDIVGTTDSLSRSINKVFHDGVAVDDSISVREKTLLTKLNVASAFDLLKIQTSKGATDVASMSDTITVLYIPGSLMLFNSVSFNESTFG